MALVSAPNFLGDPRIQTQHFIGAAARWERTSDTTVVAHHQMRVAHQKYADADARTEVLAKGHCHGGAVMHYRKVEGQWKFAGVEPRLGWTEYDFDQIFTGLHASVGG